MSSCILTFLCLALWFRRPRTACHCCCRCFASVLFCLTFRRSYRLLCSLHCDTRTKAAKEVLGGVRVGREVTDRECVSVCMGVRLCVAVRYNDNI